MAAYDASALAPLLTDDIVWWSPPSASRFGIPRPIVGKDEVVRLFTGGLGVYRAGTITWEVHQLVAEAGSSPTLPTRSRSSAEMNEPRYIQPNGIYRDCGQALD